MEKEETGFSIFEKRDSWKDDKIRQDLGWWEKFFQEEISQSDFLMGRVKDFRANLDWITGPKNFSKILNGTYKNKETKNESWL